MQKQEAGTSLHDQFMDPETDPTSDSDPAVQRLSNSRDVTPVESFIRLANTVDGHVSCRAATDEEAISVEISWEIRGGNYVLIRTKTGGGSRSVCAA